MIKLLEVKFVEKCVGGLQKMQISYKMMNITRKDWQYGWKR